MRPKMRRRDFVTMAASAAAAWSLPAIAQRPKVMRIAVLMGIADDREGQARFGAFRRGLADLKWEEGRTVHLDVRWGAGDADKIRTYASELLNLAPDVILATNTPTARTLKQAAGSIPIVFAGLSDPIGDGIVESLARPAGNITGFTSFNAETGGKWLELLKEIAPATKQAAAIFNPATAAHALFLPTMEAVAPRMQMALARAEVSDEAGIRAAFGKLADTPGTGLVLIPDVFLAEHHKTIFGLATAARLPTVCPTSFFAREGGLAAYGSNFSDLFREAAGYVDRILKGEKPGNLPVQNPTKYELVINLKAARALGVTVPPTLLARADEVVE
jgi:putative tryptophan/tyrosine transport system substrate-binding protein